MSERHGLTLRKKRNKRPIISAPTTAPVRPDQQPAQPEKPVPTQRERKEPTETSDLVKRRYSTRYNQLPNFGDVPDVPALPNQVKRASRGGSPRRPTTAQSAHPLTIDQTVLADPNLQHERYVADLLSNASEQDIQDYQNNLKRVKHRTSIELQQSVYQNRTQFIKISKEAEKLKSEMSVLRGLMSELTTALGQTNITNGTSLDGGAAARRAANRTSVANLESMWNTQLQQLWKQVEKSQKFLPAIPGRHVVMETGSWIELDSATWKAKRPVHIVLLNDHVLVASKKRKRMDPNMPDQGPAPTKLVAEECWPLLDIELVDMVKSIADGPTSKAEERAISSAVTIRSGNRSLTYRHEKRDQKSKNDLLVAYRKTAEDLRKASLPSAQDKSTAAKQQDSLNYFAARDPATAKNTEIITTINNTKEKPDILIEVDGKQQTFRWVESQLDQLDIDVALQRFDTAVTTVERLRDIARSLNKSTNTTTSTTSITQNLILAKVDERAAKLAGILCRDLNESTAFIEATKRTTTYLIRLGFEDKAREVYLESRSAVVSTRARQCVFDGDLHKYVFGISYVYFTVIKNTVVIFQASFSPATMSACIKWANDQLETFNALLMRQLSSVESGGRVWSECMDVVWTHEKEMLASVGLDFREVIGRGLDSRGRALSSSSHSTSIAGAGAAGAGTGVVTGTSEGETKSQQRPSSRPGTT